MGMKQNSLTLPFPDCLAGAAALLWRASARLFACPERFACARQYGGLPSLACSSVWVSCISAIPMREVSVVPESIITCPACSTAKTEAMPMDACLYFYECTGCGSCYAPSMATAVSSVPTDRCLARRSKAVDNRDSRRLFGRLEH
jgi:hypothetical protein